jgi:hypothetical protein
MDAGLAAVLGAVAGALATTGAGLATGWSTREQARIAARAEHRRQRREPRETVYRDFIAAVTAVREIAFERNFEAHVPGTPVRESQQQRRMHEALSAVRDCWLSVALQGPERVSTAASALEQHCRKIGLFYHWNEVFHHSDEVVTVGEFDEWQIQDAELLQSVNDAVDAFVKIAQEVLDDDGSI